MVWALVCSLFRLSSYLYAEIYPAYWKGNSQSQSQGTLAGMSQSRTSNLLDLRTQTRQGTGIHDDSDSDTENLVSRKGKIVKPTRGQAATSQTRARSRPLFLDSDDNELFSLDNDDGILGPEHNEDATTLQSSALKTQELSRRSNPVATKRGTKKAPVIVDDDSDDGTTFKGFRGRKRGTR